MYARPMPDGRFPKNMQLPRNYSGNAFRQEESSDLPREPSAHDESAEKTDGRERWAEDERKTEDNGRQAPTPNSPSGKSDEPLSAGRLFPSPGFRLDLSRFLGREKGAGIGFEELLILGLILLVSGGERKDSLILLLFLLLFIE